MTMTALTYWFWLGSSGGVVLSMAEEVSEWGSSLDVVNNMFASSPCPLFIIFILGA